VEHFPDEIETGKYPLKEMNTLGYFGIELPPQELKEKAEELLHQFFNGAHQEQLQAFNRTGFKIDANLDEFALHAWRTHVLQLSEKLELPRYNQNDISEDFIKSLAILTQFDSGIELITKSLHNKGIALITDARHMPKTYLDGAAMMNTNGNPVIGLTYRHNRLDNCWYTLFHELGHVLKHLKTQDDIFFDDSETTDTSKQEREADEIALNTLIPLELWKSEIRHLKTAGEVRAAAKRLSICPSIIAGRLRKENNNYRIHRSLLGSGSLRD